MNEITVFSPKKPITESRIEKLTFRQKEIIRLLYRFRYLNRFQLQSFLHNKNHSYLLALISDLIKKGFIGKIYNNKSGENRTPSVFYLTKKGVRTGVQNRKEMKSSYVRRLLHEGKASHITKQHSLMTAECFLTCFQYASLFQQRIHALTKAELLVTNAKIKPDGYFVINNKHTYFLEVDLETEGITALRNKLSAYFTDYFRTCREEETVGVYPCVIYVTKTKQRISILMREIEQLLSSNSIPKIYFKCTTFEEFFTNGPFTKIASMPFFKDVQFSLF